MSSDSASAADVSVAPLQSQQTTALDKYRQLRNGTISLTDSLSAEDQLVQSMPDVSPTKWHLAHTTWFFETFLLGTYLDGYQTYHPRYGFLFNSYYNTVGHQYPRPERGLMSRPALEDILRYRDYVDDAMADLLTSDVEADRRFGLLVETGFAHEQQHQELILTDIKHVLGRNPLFPAYDGELPIADDESAPACWTDHPGGLVSIGFDGDRFAFDNERPRHQTWLEPFAMCSRLVTNGEYLEFIDSGGYADPRWWLSDGWMERQLQGWNAPLYWHQQDSGWCIFTLGGLRHLRSEEPVSHVSYYEADAFARWANARLPTEAEWESVASTRPHQGNLQESGFLHPMQVSDHSGQYFGDVWEWTQSPYVAYPGFHPNEGSLGEYNGKFMCNQLVLRGGSCLTPRDHIRATYRNFFPANSRWQFAGFRLARNA